MDYIVYKRFRGLGIGGTFNLPYGTVVQEAGGFLVAPDGRTICAVTSENGWCHFRPNTEEGAYRLKLLDELYRFYESSKGDMEDFTDEKWPEATNLYWKNILRTMPTPELTAYYMARLGAPKKGSGT